MINKILVLLILNLSFINLAKSEDIKDFQIESISVGDKLNTHISDKVLKNGRKYSFKSPEYVSYEFAKDDFESDFVKFYDNIMLAVNNRNIIVPYEHNHRADKTGKSIVYGESINIDQHQITIQCFDWNNKKLGFTDNLRVSIRTDEYNLFLRDKAF